MPQLHLPEDRFLGPDPMQKALALELYGEVRALPLICPHGHVDPRLFAQEDYRFGSPVDLLIIPDHYIYRMLYSQGITLEALGIPRRDGAPVEQDHRLIWRRFAENFHLFNGTPTGIWLNQEFADVFDVEDKLTPESADAIYDQIAASLADPAFTPRRLFEQFNIEVLATTDAAGDTLAHHQAIRDSGWGGDIRPTFRPDAAINLHAPGWRTALDQLSAASGIDIGDYASFITALEKQRAFFKSMGATATDHAALVPHTERLTPREAGDLFECGLRNCADAHDSARFTAHMLMEMARMSAEDGLVMQIHAGSMRNYNSALAEAFGPDTGHDIPIASGWTRGLHALLNEWGNDPRFRVILFTLDESTYARELAPLAGHFPAVLLGPPWWFHDSVNGMVRYFDRVMETAGLWNTAGFNDDTRAFASIPARHDVWRRVAVNWLAGLVMRGFIDRQDAATMAHALAYGLAKRAYNL